MHRHERKIECRLINTKHHTEVSKTRFDKCWNVKIIEERSVHDGEAKHGRRPIFLEGKTQLSHAH